MKRVYIGLAVIGVLVFVLGWIFVFGDKVLDSVDSGEFLGRDSYVDKERGEAENGEQVIEDERRELEDVVKGEADGAGEPSESEVGYRTQQVQYSLRNFVESVECLENGTTKCNKIGVNCSVEVYNLDHEVGGIFGIRYSLISDEKELDSEVAEKDIGVGEMGVLKVGFVREGSFGFDVDWGCSIDMESVPQYFQY